MRADDEQVIPKDRRKQRNGAERGITVELFESHSSSENTKQSHRVAAGSK